MAQQPPRSGPLFSPDRQWWWDGVQWVPASQAPQQHPPAPPTPPSRTSAGTSRAALFIGVGVGVAVLLLTGVCVAAVGSSRSPRPAPVAVAKSPATAQTTAPKATATPAMAPARDGSCTPQPCANDNYGWIVVVSDVKYDVQSGNQFERPEAGNVFVTLNVTFTNQLEQEQHASPFQFVLLDGAGVKHTTTLLGPCRPWSAVNVTMGGTYGPKCLAFEAVAGKPNGLVLVWTPSFGDYRIKLS